MAILDVTVKLESINSKPEIKIEEVNIIGSNDTYFVVDDHSFTKYKHKKDKYGYSPLNEVVVSDYTKDSLLRKVMGQFRIHILSDMSRKCIENKINEEFNKFLKKKAEEYGAGREVNISFDVEDT